MCIIEILKYREKKIKITYNPTSVTNPNLLQSFQYFFRACVIYFLKIDQILNFIYCDISPWN